MSMSRKRALTVVAALALVGVLLPCPEAGAAYAYNGPTPRTPRHHGGIGLCARCPGCHGQARLARATDVDCDGIVGATDLIRVRNAFRAAHAGAVPENVCGGAAKRYYVNGTKYIDERILIHDVTAGTEHYYVPQDMHTVSALADASGALVETYRYDAYGKVSMKNSQGNPIQQSAKGNPFFFTGRWLDFYTTPTGYRKQFYDYRARTYDPENGRFLQRDPSGYTDGNNLYEAFGGNPVRFTDPSGREIWVEAQSFVQRQAGGRQILAVHCYLNRDAFSKGILAGLATYSGVHSEYIGIEQFPLSGNLRARRNIDTMIENRRQLIEQEVEANANIAAQELAIEFGLTGTVAAATAGAFAPVATGLFSTTLAGNVAAASLTGGVSLGMGEAVSEAAMGGGPGEVAWAGVVGFDMGAILGAPAGLAVPVGLSPVVGKPLAAQFTARAAAPVTGKPALRLSYEAEVHALRGRVSQLRQAGMNAEEIARTLTAERNAVKLKYRALTPPDLLEKIDARNLQKYGNKLGPSVEYLRERGKEWWQIIRGATRPGGQDLF